MILMADAYLRGPVLRDAADIAEHIARAASTATNTEG